MQTPSKHPQEIEVWYILPAIRKYLVEALKKLGHTQKKIAGLLNVTESAVSQYTKAKRAQNITLSKDVVKVINESAAKISDSKSAYREIQKISEYIKSSKALCQIHMQVEGSLDNCDICYKE